MLTKCIAFISDGLIQFTSPFLTFSSTVSCSGSLALCSLGKKNKHFQHREYSIFGKVRSMKQPAILTVKSPMPMDDDGDDDRTKPPSKI